jgi:hypothetical protein
MGVHMHNHGGRLLNVGQVRPTRETRDGARETANRMTF